MVELENKVLLNLNEYKILKKHHFFKEKTKQINYYYDKDDGFYSKSGITCRIRKKGKDYTATIKMHTSNNKHASTEYSQPAKDKYDDTIFSYMKIKYQGKLKTNRLLGRPFDGIEVALDKNIYLNKVDYELEIEYSPLKKSLANEIMYDLASYIYGKDQVNEIKSFIKRNGTGLNKSQRFFEQFNDIRR